MRDTRKTEIRVGLTVIIGIFLLVWILGWARNYSLAPDRLFLIVKFPNVSGLEVGDQITVSGVRKGYVEDIVPKGRSVYVKLNMDSDSELKTDARFEVMMLDLMGGKKIEIYPGEGSDKIDPNSVYQGKFVADIPTVMNLAGDLSDKVPAMVENVNRILVAVRDLLENKQQKENLETSLANLQVLTTELRAMVVENKPKFESVINNTQKLTTDATKLLSENRKTIDSTLQVSLKAINELHIILGKADKFITETENKQNNAGKLLYDPTMISDLKETLKSVDQLIKTLNEQLKNEGVKVKADFEIF